jgi:hypothetical protein
MAWRGFGWMVVGSEDFAEYDIQKRGEALRDLKMIVNTE